MKILLIYPPNPSYCVLDVQFSRCEPLGIEYIAASLLSDHDVDIVDMRFDDDLVRLLCNGNYDVVGIAVPFTTSINACNTILRQISNYAPEALVIVGGHYPSTSLEKLELKHVDYVISGEGVPTISHLLAAVSTRGEARDIAGAIAVRNGVPQPYKPLAHIEIENCPLPARNLLSKHWKQYFHAHYDPISLMRFSVGCPFNCSFCILWKMTNRKYITRSASSILTELSIIDSPNVYVVDDEAFIQLPRMSVLADEIRKSGIRKKYHMYVRSDTIIRNPVVFEKWAAAGLDSVLVGLESMFSDELQQYNKNISLAMARECIQILHSNGIEIRANFIIKPDYTIDKFRQVRDIVEELGIDRPTFAVLTPFIGTDTYEELKDQIIIDKPEFYDCYHALTSTTLPLKTFYKEFAGLFRAAQQRDSSPQNNKIFYSGRGNSFESFVNKIEESYRYYSPTVAIDAA